MVLSPSNHMSRPFVQSLHILDSLQQMSGSSLSATIMGCVCLITLVRRDLSSHVGRGMRTSKVVTGGRGSLSE